MSSWWDAYCKAGGLEDLETWLGDVDHPSRVRLRERIAQCEYQTVLDCGAGIGLDYIGMDNLSHEVEWRGIEPSREMRRVAQGLMLEKFERDDRVPIKHGTIENIPYGDSKFDLVYARHILEHLPRVEKPLNEMIRVARLEAIVVFFMRPGRETYLTRERDGLWQNWHSRASIEEVVQSNPKTAVWFWETLGSEALLHVYLNDALTVDEPLVADRKHD